MENIRLLTAEAVQNGFKQATHMAIDDKKNINLGDLSSDRYLYAQIDINTAAENEIAQTNEQEKINKPIHSILNKH